MFREDYYMNETKNILSSLIEQVKDVIDKFYQHSTRKRFIYFDDILKQLLELANHLSLEGELGQHYLEEGRLLSVLTEMAKALEQKDETLLADILQYDLLELLTEMEKDFELGRNSV